MVQASSLKLEQASFLQSLEAKIVHLVVQAWVQGRVQAALFKHLSSKVRAD